jgi:mRNA interferase MazF
MERFVRGQVVIIPFPFSDLSSAKRRPALVLAVLPFNDLLLCQISSKFRLDRHALALDSTDFASGSLPSQSYVRCGKLFAAAENIVERTAGTLTDQALSRIARLNADVILGLDTFDPSRTS